MRFSSFRGGLAWLCAFILGADIVYSQNLNLPNIAYAYPAGAQRGSTVKITLGGRNFKNFKAAYFSFDGVKSEPVEVIIPAQKNDANIIRKKIQKIVGEKYKAEDASQLNKITVLARKNGDCPELFAEMDKASLMYKVREYSSDPMAETIVLNVEIPPDAPIGKNFLKIQTASGVSNTVPFYIDNLPEYVKPCMRQTVMELISDGKSKEAQNLIRDESKGIVFPHSSEPIFVKPPLVVNGQICLKGTDRYSFEAKKGQNMVFAVMARVLIPYLGDAVPGWFQPSITLYDSDGDEVGYSDDFYQYPDPLLSVVIPHDGVYTLAIKDAVYRGREDFVYRMLIGSVPYITGIFPLGAQKGCDSKVSIIGWNIKDKFMSFSNPNPGVKRLKMNDMGIYHSDVPFMVDETPSTFEKEPNSDAASANEVPFPICIDGMIQTPNDKDFYKMNLKKGETVSAEIFARRLNSPMDSFLKVYSPTGKILAHSDDEEDPSEGMITHHADSHIIFTAPEDGVYAFEVSESQSKYGDEYSYRLKIAKPVADYRLKVDKTTLTMSAGKTASFKVYAFRKNGITYPIKLRLKNAPEGFVLSGGLIPAGADSAFVTISAPAKSSTGMIPIEIEGEALGKGGGLRRKAEACEYMLQAFYINHLVPMGEDFYVFVLPQGKIPRHELSILEVISVLRNKKIQLEPGKDCVVELPPIKKKFDWLSYSLELRSPPDGVSVKGIEFTSKGSKIVFACAKEAKSGWEGNLVADIYFSSIYKNGKKSKPKKLDTLPAISASIK